MDELEKLFPGDRPSYYKRDGTPIRDLLEWGRLMEDREYRREV